jgi:hypothetical protein
MQSLTIRVYDKGMAIILKAGRNISALVPPLEYKRAFSHYGVFFLLPNKDKEPIVFKQLQHSLQVRCW